MAQGKRTGRGGRPVLGAGGSANESKPSTAKETAEAMFRGEGINTDAANDRPQEWPIEATIPATSEAISDPESTVQGIVARIEDVFAAIGTEALPETLVPAPSGKNNGIEAREYVQAEILRKAAESRFKKAKEAADAAGVFGDKARYAPGKTLLVFKSPQFTISAKKGEPSTMVNRELVTEVLREVAPKKWQELLERCLKPRDGATSIIIAMD